MFFLQFVTLYAVFTDHIPSSPLLSDLGDLGAPSPLSSDLDSDEDEAELEDNLVASAVKVLSFNFKLLIF